MKRSHIQRRSPLRRSPVRRKSHARRGVEIVDWQVVRGLVVERSGGRCEGNTPDCPRFPHRGEHLHHVILRAQGGPDEVWNLLHLCAAAHGWVHANPAKSYELGLLRRGVA